MMIRILDNTAESLHSVLAALKNNATVSVSVLDTLQKALSQITEVENELCRMEMEEKE